MNQEEGTHIYDLPELAPENSPTENLTFIELCYGILFQPKETFRKLALNPPVLYSFYIVLIVGILLNIVNIFVGLPSALEQMSKAGNVPKELLGFLAYMTEPGVVILAGLAGLIFTIAWWFMNSALLHLLAEMYGGKGRALGVLAVIGVARLPNILIIPVSTLIYVVNGPAVINSLVSVFLFIYTSLYLPVVGISKVHQFSYGRGVATVVTPIALIFLGTVLLGMLMLAIIGVMAPMFEGIS